jgi:hypothetical protein
MVKFLADFDVALRLLVVKMPVDPSEARCESWISFY